ncbi:hypothetical protein J7E88_09255 [Streptomyces sp. ISL-10]|nr:hypothetical protein [Streptomyces sp. ISL-10]MBT2365502.1 hypothetical protein [Streptomyces sp. ISL-10]
MTQPKGADGAEYANEELDAEGLVTQSDDLLVASLQISWRSPKGSG